MGTLANVGVDVKIDNKTIAMLGATIFFAVLIAVIIAKKV